MAKTTTKKKAPGIPKPKTSAPIPTPPVLDPWREDAKAAQAAGRMVEIPARVKMLRDVMTVKAGSELSVAPDAYQFDMTDPMVSHAKGIRLPDDSYEVLAWRFADEVPDQVEDGDGPVECWMANYDSAKDEPVATVWFDGLTSASIGTGYEVLSWRAPDWREVALEDALPFSLLKKFSKGTSAQHYQCLGDLAAEWKHERKYVITERRLTPDDVETLEQILSAGRARELTWNNRTTWRAEENGGTAAEKSPVAKKVSTKNTKDTKVKAQGKQAPAAADEPECNGGCPECPLPACDKPNGTTRAAAPHAKRAKASAKPVTQVIASDFIGDDAERLLAIELKISRLAVQEAKVVSYLKQLRRDMGDQQKAYQKMTKASIQVLPLFDGILE